MTKHITPHPRRITTGWAPTPDGVAKLIARIKPQRFDGALCAGKAPLFDRKQRPDESDSDYQARREYIKHHCRACPVTHCHERLNR